MKPYACLMEICVIVPYLWKTWKRSRLVTRSVGRFPGQCQKAGSSSKGLCVRTDKKSRSLRKAIPVPFCDVNALLTEKFVVLLLDLGRPRRLYVPHDQLLPTMPFRPDTLMFPLRRGIRLGLLLLLRLLEGGARRRG